jgi:NitT/TauT family transport system permease protein
VNSLLQRLAPPALTLLITVILWEAVVRGCEVPEYMVPAPSVVAAAAWNNAGTLWNGFLLTTLGAVLGGLLSALVGVCVAIVLAGSRHLERAFYPFTVFLQTVPLVTIAPLLVIWFGYGLRPVIVSAFVVSLFPVIANTLNGLRSVDPNLRDLFRLYGASRLDRLLKLELPAAVPSMFTGFRISAGLAVIGAIVGEFFTSYAGEDAGLGVLVTSWLKQYHTDRVFAAVALASLLGLLMFSAVNLAGHLLLRRWHASAQDAE